MRLYALYIPAYWRSDLWVRATPQRLAHRLDIPLEGDRLLQEVVYPALPLTKAKTIYDPILTAMKKHGYRVELRPVKSLGEEV